MARNVYILAKYLKQHTKGIRSYLDRQDFQRLVIDFVNKRTKLHIYKVPTEMKLTLFLVVYVWHFLIDSVISAENDVTPCVRCELHRTFGLEPSFRHSRELRYNSAPAPRRPFPRSDEITPEEREERINRSFARFMQLLTFLGHVDNYLTDKASGLIRTMGRAMEVGDEPDEDEAYERISQRQTQPRIKTTITS